MPRVCWLGFWVLAAGCGSPLDNIDVASASLGSVSWSGMDVVVGFSESPAVLNIVDPQGAGHAFDVTISGPVLGFVFDVGVADTNPDDCLLQSSANLDIPAGKRITGADLSGGYFGTKEGAHLAIGGESHDLTNGAGVKLSGGSVNLGIGLVVGVEWLGIGVN